MSKQCTPDTCMSDCDDCPYRDEEEDLFRDDDVRAWGYDGDCD